MPSWSPKKPNLDANTSPGWIPKISLFPESCKNCNYSYLWSMMLLGSLQEPPKSPPRACQEASRRHPCPPEAPKSPQEAPMQPPSNLGQQRMPQSSQSFGAAVLAPWASSIIKRTTHNLKISNMRETLLVKARIWTLLGCFAMQLRHTCCCLFKNTPCA